tara:strand:- start:9 stop:596 length:588 start_codon:yes stop_codon:yes gene_type:complete
MTTPKPPKPKASDQIGRILELWAQGMASLAIGRECLPVLTKNAVLGAVWRYRQLALAADAPVLRIRPKSTTPKPKRIRLRALVAGDVAKRRRSPKPAAVTPVAAKPVEVKAVPAKVPVDWAARLVEVVPADAVRFDKRVMGFQCSWIYTDTSKPPAMCCGRATRPGSQYCPDHYARTWMAPKPRALPVHPHRRAA